ncbi:multi-sensor signal transduction histidine kinase [Sulfuricella denitrificans skB26]|uniref:Multi-sensor signal transduction histidine kinase n=1 Tax=Sulfuricella denitrificans (strain DSM 22764 / NBRC 105220 / skB26) TaxID=1163617 RepID=S6A9V6_SULDS|nr:PAS domain-containing protein [Sulfuricella denitrificans]BAN34775.1 multi-sensor signal transduction histidine kinase [Sulfuricella denitrificans skB26]
MAEGEKMRIDPAAMSKSELVDQLNQLQANAKTDLEQSEAQLLHELQVHQIELEMQNLELREAQQRLEEARDRYADLYDFAPIGYLTLEGAGRILEINLTGAAMLGDERANLIGKPFSARLARKDSQLFFLYLNRVFHSVGGSNIVTEVKIKRGDAVVDVHLESAPMKSTAGQDRTCRMVMTDISEQKRAKGTLKQTLLAQEALLNTIPAKVFFKDKDLRYTAVSQGCQEFFGRQVADILGKTNFDLIPRKQAEGLQRMELSVLLSGVPERNIEHMVTDSKGNQLFFTISLAPYFGPDGKTAGLVGVSVDVTPIREAEHLSQDLLRQNRLLTQRLFSLQESERRHLARELHDELGQWLTAIQAEAGAICSNSGAEREPEICAIAQAIGNSATEVQSVIRRILRRLRPALLDELGLTDSLQELAIQWRQHHPKIVCDMELDGNLGDLSEALNITLYRIVQEALTNIANHAQAHHVKVWLRRVPDVASDPEHLLLTVQDDGKGMYSNLPLKGLGMLGMRERVIASGGEFMSQSAPGKGVCIEIRLPLVAPMEERRKT